MKCLEHTLRAIVFIGGCTLVGFAIGFLDKAILTGTLIGLSTGMVTVAFIWTLERHQVEE